MATSQTCCHLPGEMLNSAADCADRARICVLVTLLSYLTDDIDNIFSQIHFEFWKRCGALVVMVPWYCTGILIPFYQLWGTTSSMVYCILMFIRYMSNLMPAISSRTVVDSKKMFCCKGYIMLPMPEGSWVLRCSNGNSGSTRAGAQSLEARELLSWPEGRP
jgi:hypothetical protein